MDEQDRADLGTAAGIYAGYKLFGQGQTPAQYLSDVGWGYIGFVVIGTVAVYLWEDPIQTICVLAVLGYVLSRVRAWYWAKQRAKAEALHEKMVARLEPVERLAAARAGEWRENPDGSWSLQQGWPRVVVATVTNEEMALLNQRAEARNGA